MASRPCRRPHNHPICRSRSTGAATLHWPEPRPCRPVSKGGTANKPPGGNRARPSKSRRAARLLGKPRLLTQVRLPARCRHDLTRPLKNRRRKFVASVTFLSFKSRERWHYPPCKRTAVWAVHWSAQVVVAPERMQR